jgi:hypothetical protein
MITKVATCKQQYDGKSDQYICKIHLLCFKLWTSHCANPCHMRDVWPSVGKFSGLKCQTQGVQVQVPWDQNQHPFDRIIKRMELWN